MNVDYESLLQSLRDGVYFTDRDRRITYWNRAATQITGFRAEEVVGTHCYDHVLTHINAQGDNLCGGGCLLAASVKDGGSHEGQVYLHHKDGHRVPVAIRVAPLRDPEGNVVGAAELFTDLSPWDSVRQRVRELESLAMLDPLTRLANRRYLEAELDSLFREMERYDLRFGLLMMDVDQFKKVNDHHGHAIGDQVLQMVAGTLLRSSRPFDLYGRWGGEEFVGLVRNVDAHGLREIGERCRMLVEKSYLTVGGSLLSVTVSVGGVLASPRDSAESLLERADRLMYRGKQAGRNCLMIDTDET